MLDSSGPRAELPGSPEFRVASSTIAPEYALAGVTSCLLTIVSAALLIYASDSVVMITVALICLAAGAAMLFTARYHLRAELQREAERQGLSAAPDYARAAEARWLEKQGRTTHGVER